MAHHSMCEDHPRLYSAPATRSVNDGAAALALYPRRKVGGRVPEKNRAPLKLHYGALATLFDRPQPEAARELGIALTTLKHVCRKIGIRRWPYSRKHRGIAREACYIDEDLFAKTTRGDSSASLNSLCSTVPDNCALNFEDASEEAEIATMNMDLSGTTTYVGGGDTSMLYREASDPKALQSLREDSSPEVLDHDVQPDIADPFAADSLNNTVASPVRSINGWAVPTLAWLTPCSVTAEAERKPDFWRYSTVPACRTTPDPMAVAVLAFLDSS